MMVPRSGMQGFSGSGVYIFETTLSELRGGGSVIGLEAHNDSSRRQRRVPFLCECGHSLCPERVWLTRIEYDRLLDRVGLVLAPGHEDWDPVLGQCGCGRSRQSGDGGFRK
jgi:hypothetical protein